MAASKLQMAHVVRKVPLRQQPADCEFWLTQSYEARLAALEEIRSEYARTQEDEPEPGFQRVYRIIKRR